MSERIPICIIASAPAFGFKTMLGRAVKERFGDRITTISTGNCVRKRLKECPDFRDKYALKVEKGGLVPFEELLPEVEQLYNQARCLNVDGIWLDGVCREVGHAQMLHERGIVLPEHTMFMAINTSIDTCKKRRDFSLTVAKDRTERNDNDSLEERYRLHYEEEPRIIDFLQGIGVSPVIINGNVEKKFLEHRVVMRIRDKVPFPHTVRL